MRLIEACSYPLYGGKALRRQRPAAAQIFASLVFDLSHFYATVADFRTRVQYLFSKPRYSVLMSLHLGRSRAVRGIRQRIKRHAKQAIGKRASQRVKQPICQNEIRPFPAPSLVPAARRPLTQADSLPILGFPLTTKGGDPVSFTKRCHLAGIA